MEWKWYLGSYGFLVDGEHVLLVGNDFGEGRIRWGLPGGNLEAGETYEDTVVREVLEETGLRVRARRLRYITEHLFVEKSEPWFLHPLRKALEQPSEPLWHEVWRHD